MSKIWYAILKDREDNDWGTGSHDRAEAVRMAKENGYELIAVIEEAEGDATCIDEIDVNEEPLPPALIIKRLRNLDGKTSRTAFAKKYNIPLRTVENWESGANEPPEYVIDLLARAVIEDLTGKPAGFLVTSTAIGTSGEPDGDQFDVIRTRSLTQALAEAQHDRAASDGKYLTEIRIDEGDEEMALNGYYTFEF